MKSTNNITNFLKTSDISKLILVALAGSVIWTLFTMGLQILIPIDSLDSEELIRDLLSNGPLLTYLQVSVLAPLIENALFLLLPILIYNIIIKKLNKQKNWIIIPIAVVSFGGFVWSHIYTRLEYGVSDIAIYGVMIAMVLLYIALSFYVLYYLRKIWLAFLVSVLVHALHNTIIITLYYVGGATV